MNVPISCLSPEPGAASMYTLHRKKVTFNLSICPGAPVSLTLTYGLDDMSICAQVLYKRFSLKVRRNQARQILCVNVTFFWWRVYLLCTCSVLTVYSGIMIIRGTDRLFVFCLLNTWLPHITQFKWRKVNVFPWVMTNHHMDQLGIKVILAFTWETDASVLDPTGVPVIGGLPI